MLKHKISTRSAMAIVIANMIGTGVFTSLGFQLQGTTNTWSILLLWVMGAIMALCGAVTYAELGTKMNRSGGEYHFLSQVYGKHLGYLSGWASLTLGFAAPIALAAMAAGAYTQSYLGVDDKLIAALLVVVVSGIHMFDLNKSSGFQNITTAIKLGVILLFVAVGLAMPSPVSAFEFNQSWQQEILLPSFAISLIYVSYSFSGWNAAAYIVDEIHDAKRNLPKALIGGTLLVSSLYVLLQWVFLKHAGLSELQGELEVGQIVAANLFGEWGGKLISALIALMLVSSISAMVWVGPRVTRSMAEDYPIWRPLAKANVHGIPNRAIALQAFIAITMIFSGTFEQVLTYSSFVLQLFVALTVFGLFFVRQKHQLSGYQAPWFPFPQLIFLAISLWILAYLALEKPTETLTGLAIVALGSVTYFINQFKELKRSQQQGL